MMSIMSQSLLKTAIVFVSFFQLSQAQTTETCPLTCKVKLVIFKDTTDNNRSYTFNNTAEICTSEFFNETLPSIVMVHPYKSDPNKEGPQRIMKACVNNGTSNCILVDWSYCANTDLFPIDMFFCPLTAAKELGSAFINLFKCMPPSKLHLFGASLGGWIACYAASIFKAFSEMAIAVLFTFDISRVKGNIPGCDGSCAVRTFSTHCDWITFGVDYSPWATINIQFNADTFNAYGHQPGCPKYNFLLPMFSTENICSHRACTYIGGSALDIMNSVLANYAENETVWKKQGGVPNKPIDLGQPISVPLEYGGKYFCTLGRQIHTGLVMMV